MRIISTVPSQTELLADLGLDIEVVGITKFCLHPNKWYMEKDKIGGTKNLKIEKIRALSPDLIVANKEENVKSQIESLAQPGSVILTEIKTLEDNLELILNLGKITDRVEKAVDLHEKFSDAAASLKSKKKLKAAYLIWMNPLMTIGGDTFIHSMMKWIGFRNVFGDSSRYPTVDMKELKKKKPEVLMLSSEPFPFTEKHVAYFKEQLPSTHVMLVDGEAFSWYGSRMLRKLDYLKDFHSKL